MRKIFADQIITNNSNDFINKKVGIIVLPTIFGLDLTTF